MTTLKRMTQSLTPRARRFCLLNLLLILVYLWTLTETTTVRLAVAPDVCTAHAPQRSLTIPCPGLHQGFQTFLYEQPERAPDLLGGGLLDWLIPDSTWDEAVVRTAHGGVQAQLRRASHSAGIVLLQQGLEEGQSAGWAFVVMASERLGVWQRWENGQLAEPIAGIPFQKPALAQFQSLLRRILNAHHAALLLLAVAALLRSGWRRLLSRRPAFSARSEVKVITPSHLRTRLVCLPLLLLTFALSLHIAIHVLERIPHVQDSVTYLFQAQTLARGQLSAPAPPVPEAFEQEFLLVRDGRWFGKYPPGYPALLALGVLPGAPWLVNPLLAVLTVALLWALARRLYPRARLLAPLSAALPLISPFFLFLSGSHMAHSAELFWMALFMTLWLAALRRPANLLAVAGAGAAFGALFLTRQLSAVAAALPFLLLSLLWRMARDRSGRITLLRRLAPAALAAAPFLLLLFAHQWLLTGDPWQDPRLLFWEYDHLGFGQDIGEGQNAFTLVETPEGLAQVWYDDPSQPARGHSLARGLYNVQRNWLALERDLFGWLPAFSVAFIWLAFLLYKPPWQDWALLLLFTTLTGAYILYWADGVSYGPRYLFVTLPALFLLTARGAQQLAAWLGGQSGKLAVASLLFLLAAGAAIVNGPRYLQHYQEYNFVSRDALSLLEQQTQKPALVFVEPGADWWRYGALFSANTPWLDGPIVVARDLDPRTNRRLISHFPERHVYRLSQDDLLQPFR